MSQYYNIQDRPLVNNDDVAGLTPTAQGFIASWGTYLSETILQNLPAQGSIVTLTVKVLFGNAVAEVQTQAIELQINDRGEVSIAGGLFSVFSQTALGVAVATGAFGLAGLPFATTLLGGIVVGGAVAVAWSTFTDLSVEVMESLIDFGFGLGDETNIKFLDSDGNHVSGVFYPDGLDGTPNEEANSVAYFITQAGSEIEAGGTLVFEGAIFDAEYRISKGDFVDTLVAVSSASGIDAFLDIADSSNRDSHVFKGDDHYFFYKDGEAILDVPITINGVPQVIEVTRVYDGNLFSNNLVYGQEGIEIIDTYSLVLPISADQGMTLYGGDGEELIIGSSQGDIISAGSDDDILLGKGGVDFLEGESGADVLDGGAGNDTLSGGFGNDMLYGGADVDTYLFEEVGFGRDTIDDNDGHIMLGGSLLSGQAEELANKPGTYAMTFAGRQLLLTMDGNDLVISRAANEVITIKNYSNGSFNLTLNSPSANPLRAEDAPSLLDLAERYGLPREDFLLTPGNEYLSEREAFDSAGNPFYVMDEDLVLTMPKVPGGDLGTDTGILDAIGAFLEAQVDRTLRSDPLVLDLDGDGIELIDVNDSNAFFDLDEDGFAERVGWIGGDDGMLAVDQNSNGQIDGMEEVFGNATTSGFVQLAPYDTNGDGLVDASDANFADLRIWKDVNEDGVTDAGELTSLAANNNMF